MPQTHSYSVVRLHADEWSARFNGKIFSNWAGRTYLAWGRSTYTSFIRRTMRFGAWFKGSCGNDLRFQDPVAYEYRTARTYLTAVNQINALATTRVSVVVHIQQKSSPSGK